jgi:hypothetical protein
MAPAAVERPGAVAQEVQLPCTATVAMTLALSERF